jgi:hypothetical protein
MRSWTIGLYLLAGAGILVLAGLVGLLAVEYGWV